MNLGLKILKLFTVALIKVNLWWISRLLSRYVQKINPGDKKVVYIGNSQKKKGADKVYEALKGSQGYRLGYLRQQRRRTTLSEFRTEP
jgi:hypothetical protein